MTVNEPTIRVAALDSGRTVQARYASPLEGSYASGTPLVLLVRGPALVPAEQVKVIKADLVGKRLTITLQRRRLSGPHTCTICLPPSAAFVEVELGALAVGDYHAVIETIDELYDDQNQPQKTTKTTKWQDRFSFHVQ